MRQLCSSIARIASKIVFSFRDFSATEEEFEHEIIDLDLFEQIEPLPGRQS